VFNRFSFGDGIAAPNIVTKFTAGVDDRGKADSYAVTKFGALWRWTEGSSWEKLVDQTAITEFAEAKEGRLYARTSDSALWEFQPNDFTPHARSRTGWHVLEGAGSVVNLDVVTTGYNPLDRVFERRGDGSFQMLTVDAYGTNWNRGWTKIADAGVVRDGFSAGLDSNGQASVYVVSALDNSFWKWTGAAWWKKLANAGVVSQYSATDNGQCWFIATNGALNKFDSTNTRQVVFNGLFYQISAAASNDVFVKNFDNSFWERKAGGVWSKIA
jgi:hypothetical protein